MAKRRKKKPDLWRLVTGALFVVLCAMLFSAVFFTASFEYYRFSAEGLLCLAIDSFGLAVLLLLFISCSRIRQDRITRLFLLILSANAVYLYLDALCRLSDGRSGMALILLIAQTGRLLLTVVLAWLYWHFILHYAGNGSRHLSAISHGVDVLFGAGAVVVAANLYFGYLFSVSPEVHCVKNEAYFASLVCPTAIFLCCLFPLYSKRELRFSEKLTLLSYPLLPYLGALLNVRREDGILTTLLAFFAVVFIYTNLFTARGRELDRKKAELAESEVKAMKLQINPHFIYNTLGSVASLCTEKPEEAKELLYTFSDYLRENFGELSRRDLIPFSRELDHLKTYLAIERVRFPDITVKWDIRTTDFSLPALSVQPLVENAITHGIMGRESGGTIRITASETPEFFRVRVEDDGVGFEKLPEKDGKVHIGIANVRARLEMLCGGDLYVRSVPGEGTVADIEIPKGEK